MLQQLLREAGAGRVTQGLADVDTRGVHQAADSGSVRSHETYVGYQRSENFASTPSVTRDRPAAYAVPARLPLNAWGLSGHWSVGAESATLVGSSGGIVYRFQARDLHLVLGPGPEGKPVRFMVSIDGRPPGSSHGLDVAEDGSGMVTEQRLYQLIRQSGDVAERTFTIEFLDPAVSAYAFTFG